MTRNQERSAPWHKDHTIKTVWPYLDVLQKRVSGLFRVVSATTGGSGSGAPGLGLPMRITEQINFSAAGATPARYIGTDDTGAATLGAALLLYRARGGEVIKSFTLSEPAGSTAAWTVEIREGYFARSGATAFSVPVRLSVSVGAAIAEQRPNQTLSPGQCLFAYVLAVDEESPGRIDGTLEIERNATL